MKAGLSPLLLLLLAGPAWAGLSRAELNAVSVSLPSPARLDPVLKARDARGKMRSIGDVLGGRPAFLEFVDYTCNTLCGTDLAVLSATMLKAGLTPADARILVIGIDPKDSGASALAVERKEIPRALWPAATLLLPDEKTVRAATAALGFRYAYDAAIDQYAHPAVVYAIGPEGAVRGVVSPFALNASNIRKFIASPAPESSSLYDRIRLLCYAYDPATGIYTLRIERVLRAAGALTVMLIAAGVFMLVRIGRRPA